MLEIYQGDQFPLSFSIENEQGEPITENDIIDMVFSIGNRVRKTYSGGDITFDSETNLFIISLTIEDTSGLLVMPYPTQLRVFFADDYVLSFNCGRMVVKACLDRGEEENG